VVPQRYTIACKSCMIHTILAAFPLAVVRRSLRPAFFPSGFIEYRSLRPAFFPSGLLSIAPFVQRHTLRRH